MNQLTTIGLDIAKNSFHLVGVDRHGHEQLKRHLTRRQLLSYFTNLPACTVVMEACSGAHHWGRCLKQMGFKVILLPAQHVRVYRKGQKNDYNDARAIIEASRCAQIHAVRIKCVGEQDIQALARARSLIIKQRTGLCNSVRGLLSEYGLVQAKGIGVLRRAIPALLEDADTGLTPAFRRLLAQQYELLVQLDQQVVFYTRELTELVRTDEAGRRLLKVPGYGPIVAAHFMNAMSDGHHLRCGRDAGVVLGLTPRHSGTGGRVVMGSITRCGDRQMRALLVHGARSVVSRAGAKTDPLSRWIQQLEGRIGHNKTVVALANKLARVGWSMIRYGSEYDPRLINDNSPATTSP